MPNVRVQTLNPEQGDGISIFGDTYRVITSGKQTGGVYAVIDMLVPPGGGPGPHAHADTEESFYVIEGEVVVRSAQGAYTARKGAYVRIPKGGAVHNFRNESKSVARLLCTVMPAGLEELFVEIGQPVAWGSFLPVPRMTPEMMKRLNTVAEAYGQRLYPPDYFQH